MNEKDKIYQKLNMKKSMTKPVQASRINGIKQDSAALSVYSDYTDERDEKMKNEIHYRVAQWISD
eukprot:CAMPEP_0205811606 /NCGR_PEP_ID=MMETSP0205-20121125/15839_1 /ASSEMBLY_ACC=CAM_ASM_000278 /TAXON_ID=36767 /ORGANISM="Euplotes focardii, Strain TN1" /LENGTH=64 /DNA_ID=CAMNT_0053091011 /DNA_START=934 /DNA_END=1125 /DNA_ORIENTATION=-